MTSTQAFDQLVDADMWVDVAAIGAGYMGASLGQTVLDGMSPFEVPNEAYGIGVAYVGHTVSMDYSNRVATGGALYTIDALAQRAGLKSAVTEMV